MFIYYSADPTYKKFPLRIFSKFCSPTGYFISLASISSRKIAYAKLQHLSFTCKHFFRKTHTGHVCCNTTKRSECFVLAAQSVLHIFLAPDSGCELSGCSAETTPRLPWIGVHGYPPPRGERKSKFVVTLLKR
jgi:hypothetical protein